MKKILFHLRQLPYRHSEAEEHIESILFAASFGYEVSVVFSDVGIWQLIKAQQTSELQRNIAKMIAAFPAFDVAEIYACEDDVTRFGLSPADFSVQLKLITVNEISLLNGAADYVIYY